MNQRQIGSLIQGQRTRDRLLLFTACFLRSVGTALVGVLLGIHLAQLGFSPSSIGVVSGTGLFGAAAGTLTITLWGDRIGRRRSLILSGLFSILGGLVLVLGTAPVTVAVAAFVGMVNAMGRDRGAALAVEHAALPATVSDRARTGAFAWYGALQDAGHALGSLLAGAPALLAGGLNLSQTAANRVTLATLPTLLLGATFCYLALSDGIEIGRSRTVRPPLSPGTRRILYRISALFALDGLGGGFLLTSLLSYFFFERFGASASAVALIFFAARLINLASNFAAAWTAARIGLVNTMVLTHIPSSLLLVGVAFVPSLGWAAIFFLLREVVAKMDVPTRQSYLMAVVEPGERIVVSGVTNIVRLMVWATGPVLAGLLMQNVSLGSPLFIGASLKISYDLLLYRAFRHLPPPEERLIGSAP